MRETLKLAREEELSVSSHFLELPKSHSGFIKIEGLFLQFFKNFLGQETAVCTPMEFLIYFQILKIYHLHIV